MLNLALLVLVLSGAGAYSITTENPWTRDCAFICPEYTDLFSTAGYDDISDYPFMPPCQPATDMCDGKNDCPSGRDENWYWCLMLWGFGGGEFSDDNLAWAYEEDLRSIKDSVWEEVKEGDEAYLDRVGEEARKSVAKVGDMIQEIRVKHWGKDKPDYS